MLTIRALNVTSALSAPGNILLLSMAVCSSAAFANPQGGVVASGEATITEAGKKLDVHQQTNRVVIDWRSFDIQPDEFTQFHQPGSSSLALNRVNSNDPSQILGRLSANGNVVIVNPNGVFFGRDSQIDVNGIIATTADTRNQDFMNGQMRFDIEGAADASIINEGTITAGDAGLVGFVAPNVRNSGTINARLGKVQLSSGDSFTMDMYGDGLMEVQLSDDVQSQLVSNTGIIEAQGGTIALTAAAGRNVVDSLISVDGEVKAPTFAQKDGKIIISGEGNGNVLVAGNVSAVNNEGGKGGDIAILGDHVGLRRGARVNASGQHGGGKIRIGGDFYGQGETRTASQTVIEEDAVVQANAITAGNGGEIAIWSDGATGFYGLAEAMGGSESGNGGFIETSGKRYLEFMGDANTSAANGLAGTLLLDPTNITISTAANTGSMIWTGTQFQDTGAVNSNLNVTTLQNQLANNNVLVTTASALGGAGNIAVNNDVTWSSAHSLTLEADNNITVNAAITHTGDDDTSLLLKAKNTIMVTGTGSIAGTSGTGALNVTLHSDSDATNGGMIYIGQNGAASINSNGGDIVLGGGLDIATGYAQGEGTSGSTKYGIYLGNGSSLTTGIASSLGSITLRGHGYDNAAGSGNVGVNINEGSSITTTAGNISITGIGGAGVSNNNGINIGSSGTNIITTTSGTIDLHGTGNSFDDTGSSNYGININNGKITSTGTGAGLGKVTLYGTGSSTGSSNNYGLFISGTNSEISTIDAELEVTGDNSANNYTAGTNYGLYVTNGAAIKSTGEGDVTATGKGGLGTSSNYGIYMTHIAGPAYSTIAAHNGALTVTGYGGSNGTGASNTGNGGIALYYHSTIASTGTGGSVGPAVIRGYGADSYSGGVGIHMYGSNQTATISTQDADMEVSGWAGDAATLAANSANHGITLSYAASIKSLSSGNLNINGYGGSGTSFVTGVAMSNDAFISALSGNINITADNSGKTYTDNYSVGLGLGDGYISTDSGDITIIGKGGDGVSYNYGVSVSGTVTITTNTGAIDITGYGGNGSTTGNTGIVMTSASSSISSTGIINPGTVKLTGYGGSQGHGVSMTHGTVSTENADIEITGTGGLSTSGTGNYGISIEAGTASGFTLSSNGSGNISLLGYGGANATSSSRGINIGSSTAGRLTTISNGNGTLTLTGIATSGTTPYGLSIGGNGGVTLGGADTSGDIRLITDTWNVTSGTALQTTGDIHINPYTEGRGMSVGTSVANTLNVSNAQLGYFNWAGTLFLGDDTNTGTLTINTSNVFSQRTAFTNAAGYDITLQTTNLTTSYNGAGNAFAFHAGRDLNMNRTITNTAVNGATSMFFGAAQSIIWAGSQGVSGNGVAINMTFNSDADDNDDGYISLGSGIFNSAGGDIILGGGLNAATDYAWGNATVGYGISLSNTQLKAGSGSISIMGHGYEVADGDNKHGISLSGGNMIVETTGAGGITLTGIGGGATGDSDSNKGVFISGGVVSSTGDNGGAITITGYGGGIDGTGSDNQGVHIYNGASVTSKDGDITILGNTGLGGQAVTTASDGSNNGVYVDLNGTVSSNGLANITLTGIGGGTGSYNNHGVNVFNGSRVSTTVGDITLTGVKGSGTSYGIATGSGATTIGGADTAGTISLTTDTWNLATGHTLQTAGDIRIGTYTEGYGMSVGANVASTLNVSNAHLGFLNWGGTLFLGDDTNTGTMTINTSNAFTQKVAFTNAAGYDITLQGNNLTTSYNGAGNAFAFHAGRELNMNRTITNTAVNGTTSMFFGAAQSIIWASGHGVSGNGAGINMTFNSDSDNDSDGYIRLSNGIFNSAGGDIILGGGLNAATDYAWGNASQATGIQLLGTQMNSGSGTITMHGQGYIVDGNANYGVRLTSNALIEATGAGEINIFGLGGGTGTGADNHGISLQTSHIRNEAAGGGNINLIGYGGGFGSTGGGNYGVLLNNNVRITTLDGDINISGNYGLGLPITDSTGNNNSGIHINRESVITTNGTGNISLIGVGGGAGTSNNGVGIRFAGNANTVESTAANGGTITFTGYGSVGTGGGSEGIDFGSDDHQITSVDGDITLYGNRNLGLAVSTSAGSGLYATTGTIRSLGEADIILDLLGNSNTASYGLTASGLTLDSTGTGDISITAVRGAGSTGQGFRTTGAVTIGNAAMNGDISIITDQWSLHADTTFTTLGDIHINPYTAGTGMSVGADPGSTLNVSNAYLGLFNWDGTLFLGDDTHTGALTIDTSNAFTKKVAFTSADGYDITLQNTNLTTSYNGAGHAFAFHAGRDLNMNRSVTNTANNGTSSMFFGANQDIIWANSHGVSGSGVAIGMTFNSDADDDDDGYIRLGNGNFNSAGGDIVLGGGLDAATDYAWGNASQGHGIQLTGTQINAGGGSITMRGHGDSNSTADDNYGIEVASNTVMTVTGAGGIDMYGIGGGKDTSLSNYGINISGFAGIRIESTGAGGGGITMHGYGGGMNGTGSHNNGVRITGATTVIRSRDGDITLHGNYGLPGQSITNADSFNNHGVVLADATISSDGDADITLMGIGGQGGAVNHGVKLEGGTITTTNGDIYISGIKGNNNGSGIFTDSGSTTTLGSGSMLGDITLVSDTLGMEGALNFQTSGDVLIAPYTNNAMVAIGSGGGVLAINDASLAMMDFMGVQSVTFGGATAGAMNINSNFVFDTPTIFRTGAANGDITLNGKLNSSADGNAFTLAAARNFINNVGADAFELSGDGRWLVYSGNPVNDTINGLASDFRRYSCTFGGACPSVPDGNGLLYSFTPTLTVSGNHSITYGDAAPALNGYSYTISGYLGDDDELDSITGTLVGSTAYTQGDNAGSYNINYVSGSLTSEMGYGFTYADNATGLTVNKAELNVTAQNATRTYGDANPAFSYIISGFVNGENLASSGVSGAASLSTTADANSSVAGGPYDIITALGTLAASNYSFNLVNGQLTITPHELTVTAQNATRTYGDANPAFSYIISGFVNGENLASSGVSGAASLSTTADANSSVAGGPYDIITAMGTLAASNYSFNLVNGQLTITPRALTVTTDNQSKNTNAPDPAFTGGHNLTAHDAALIGWTYAPVGYSGDAGTYTIAATANDPHGRLANYSRINSYGLFTVNAVAAPSQNTGSLPNTIQWVSQHLATRFGENSAFANARNPVDNAVPAWTEKPRTKKNGHSTLQDNEEG